MEERFRNAHSAALKAVRLYRQSFKSLERVEVDRLVREHKLAVEKSGLSQTLLSTRVQYAERIVGSEGVLLYEEMHKLFNLCEEIHVLLVFGYALEPEIYERYQLSVKARLQAERSAAQLVTQDRKIEGKEGYWWATDGGLTAPGR